MLTLSTDLTIALAQTTTTLAEAWLVTRTDGQAFGWTTHDVDVTIAGVTYRASEGLTATAAHNTNDLSVNTLDVTAFLDVTTEEELYAGLWDHASVTHFWYDWSNPPTAIGTDVRIVREGTLGELTRAEQSFTAEINDLRQQLALRIGRQYTTTCPWRHALWNGSTYVSSAECNLTLAPYIVTGSITSVGATPALVFQDTGSAQADGFYTDGLITMTSGPNTGLTREVRLWASDTFTLKRPYPYAVVVGNTYTAVKGDDKRFVTCQGYGNYLRFGGFPFIPGQDKIYNNPTGL